MQASLLQPILSLYVFCVGACVGSFLNVVIARLPQGESLVRPRSRCPRCLSPIVWYDNVPILSWLLLRARCRRCKAPISARYPAVELLLGLLALAIARAYGGTGEGLGFFAFAAALVALAYIDLDTWLLPHEITWPLIGFGLLSPLWNHGISVRASVAGAALGFALFAAITLFGEKVLKRELMGWGDAFLLCGIGAWTGIGAILPVVLLASLQGAVVGGVLLAIRAKPPEERDPSQAPEQAGPPAAPEQAGPPAAPEQPGPPAAPEQAGPPAAPVESGASPEVADRGAGLDDDWTPPAHAVPFGPFLALAALEQILLGDALAALWARIIGVSA